ncbi:putative membrane protein [Raoultella sp. BIGb0149]|uniref:AzlD family protein n=1 Tax=Raoultella TaxID=160674 RepID=UPI0010621861|nr:MULTISPECIES: AzlD domain-containing protein [Raoultella]MCI1033225.1 AzlD domain-containing protein [Raoultella terrigena]TDQ27089.1 putative membrane protein [Raoultella sp. BIGb0149]
MNVEMSDAGAVMVIIVMALVTLATRWGGVYVMSFVPLNGKIKRFIQAMSGSVLVAIIAPTAATGDRGAQMALLTTAILMLVLKRPLIAIAGGILVAAFVRR